MSQPETPPIPTHCHLLQTSPLQFTVDYHPHTCFSFHHLYRDDWPTLKAETSQNSTTTVRYCGLEEFRPEDRPWISSLFPAPQFLPGPRTHERVVTATRTFQWPQEHDHLCDLIKEALPLNGQAVSVLTPHHDLVHCYWDSTRPEFNTSEHKEHMLSHPEVLLMHLDLGRIVYLCFGREPTLDIYLQKSHDLILWTEIAYRT